MTPERNLALPLRIGCPVFNGDQWAGQVYPPGTRKSDHLHWYSRTFGCVEGNSTFYGLPSPQTVGTWIDACQPGFQFCFKFPRIISHDLQLRDAGEETSRLLKTLEPLRHAGLLGPTFLQLGPEFGPDAMDRLIDYVSGLPRDWLWAVELRHPGWFDRGENESRIDDHLRRLSIDKVLFDSRPLFQSPPEDPAEVRSQQRKPRTPIRQTVTANRPMLRIVGRNQIEKADSYFEEWAPTIGEWIRAGHWPYVFAHAPDNTFAPALARRMLDSFAKAIPGYHGEIPRPPSQRINRDGMRQLSLLDD